MVRLATSCDISRRPLILSPASSSLSLLTGKSLSVKYPRWDLEVITFFQWNLQLTLTGRQGLNAISCRTPVGFFYGYSHISPNDSVQAAVQATGSASVLSGGIQVPVLSQEDIQVKVQKFILS